MALVFPFQASLKINVGTQIFVGMHSFNWVSCVGWELPQPSSFF
uniref:Uncharacterized protein n=1 Tax=Anguilla anguilla TaxID=7936 RepID=A0A0E9WJ61_ANGAN